MVTVQVIGEKRGNRLIVQGQEFTNMHVFDVREAKTRLEDYARECHSSPVVVTIDGKPSFEMLPI